MAATRCRPAIKVYYKEHTVKTLFDANDLDSTEHIWMDGHRRSSEHVLIPLEEWEALLDSLRLSTETAALNASTGVDNKNGFTLSHLFL